jgi:hypothetical protein
VHCDPGAGPGVTLTNGPEGTERARWPGRSSKPRRGLALRPRWVRPPRVPAICLTLCLGVLSQPGRGAAQEPAPAPPASTPADSARALRPLPAFLHSLLLPGWGQSKLDRKLTAALFTAWEGVTLGMTLKAAREAKYLERVGADSSRIDGKRQERQDWLILLGFNHLFSGLEAYVSSQLQDFPADVRFRAAPRGFAVSAAIPLRIR